MNNTEHQHHPHIKSYVHRRGHLSNAQQNALEQALPIYGIPFQHHELNLNEVWPKTEIQIDTQTGPSSNPLWLEIGFGMGETTAILASQCPDVHYLGVEVYPPGVGALLKRIQEQNLHNIRIIQHDVVDVLKHMLPDASLQRIMIFFPDPWRKTRHHKRRLIQPEFVELLAQKTAPKGILHLATDWEHYAHHMLEVLSTCHKWQNTATETQLGGFSERPQERPLTKFEQRGLRLGHGVWDLLFSRVSAV